MLQEPHFSPDVGDLRLYHLQVMLLSGILEEHIIKL